MRYFDRKTSKPYSNYEGLYTLLAPRIAAPQAGQWEVALQLHAEAGFSLGDLI